METAGKRGTGEGLAGIAASALVVQEVLFTAAVVIASSTASALAAEGAASSSSFTTGLGWTIIATIGWIGMYGLYKLITGMLYGAYITDMINTKIECVRHPRVQSVEDELRGRKEPRDDLVTIVKLKKGANNALTLHELNVTVFDHTNVDLNSAYNTFPVHSNLPDGTRVPHASNRSINSAGAQIAQCNIHAIWTSEQCRSLNLVPAEETEYASYSSIPSNSICEVVVTVRGER